MMTTSADKLKSLTMQETDFASKIPYARFIDAETIETKDGNILQILKVTGLVADTMDDELIDMEKRIRNNLLMSLTDSSTSLYFHTIRKRVDIHLDGEYKNTFLKTLNIKRQQQLSDHDFYVNEHYITIVKKSPAGKIRKLSDFLKSLSSKFHINERERYRNETLADLNKVSKQVMTNLGHYGISKLINIYDPSKKAIVSESMSFLASLINHENRLMVAPEEDLSTCLSFKRHFFDSTSGTIAIRSVNNKVHYAAVVAIKNYSSISYAGMLDKLLDVKSELIVSQSFNSIEKDVIRNKIKESQRNAMQSDDGQTRSSEHISDVLDDMGSSEATVGEHTFTILCKAFSLRDLENAVAEIEAVLSQIGIITIREDTGLKPAFFAMLPANFSYNTRKPILLSKNMASLASMHVASLGMTTDNYWGNAVTVLETISGAPFYFNFHVLDVANTFMVGPQGSGKTLIQALLLAESMKYGGQLIVFDKDKGLEIFVRALNGAYMTLTAGNRTGFAPFQMDDTPDNRTFLSRLLRKMAEFSGSVLTSEEDEMINLAVQGAYSLPKSQRLLRNIVQFFGMGKAGSLRRSFNVWVNDGDYAWVFDNTVDDLSLNQSVFGFDMTSVMDNVRLSAVLYFYLFHRIENRLDGTRTRIVVAEGWRALQDDDFREKIKDWSSTPRKKEAFLVLDTQSPDDISASAIGRKLIQESVTQIFFSNPSAKEDDYIHNFGLSQKEFQIIKLLEKESRFFLLKQGKNSVVVRADLSEGFENEIAVLSGRSRSSKLLNEIRAEVGDDPDEWLERFYARMKRIGALDD